MVPPTVASAAEVADLYDPAYEELHRALDSLPALYREPLILHHLAGLTVEERAQRLGEKIGTVAARLSRGRRMLRERLEQRGFNAWSVPGVAAFFADPPAPGNGAAAAASTPALPAGCSASVALAAASGDLSNDLARRATALADTMSAGGATCAAIATTRTAALVGFALLVSAPVLAATAGAMVMLDGKLALWGGSRGTSGGGDSAAVAYYEGEEGSSSGSAQYRSEAAGSAKRDSGYTGSWRNAASAPEPASLTVALPAAAGLLLARRRSARKG